MNKKKEILIIAILIIVEVGFIIIGGINKSYIHMDEAYSLGLASYDKTEIQANEDFYNNWHTKEYYEDYLAVNDDEKGNYGVVYENQKNDVHPPLYYLILRFAMGFSINHFSKWPGIIINIIIYILITLVMYQILQKLLKNEKNQKEKSMIIAFMSSITLASITTALYIRMYALATLNILIAVLLHIKLLESKEKNTKILVLIGISTLVRCINTLLLFILPRNAIYNIYIKIHKTKGIQKSNKLHYNNGNKWNNIINNMAVFNKAYVFWVQRARRNR